jgi:hypothetical protein
MMRAGKIHFCCWYCNRKLAAGLDRVGERRVCNCGHRYRVPPRDGIARRDKTPLDWLLEFVIYGLGGGFFGLLFGLIVFRFVARSLSGGSARLMLIAVPVIVGGLVGGLFGERGINWIGSFLRNVVEDEHH